MAANNQIVLIGRVGKDPEIRTITSGRTVASFSLAVRRNKDVTDWFAVEAWGKQAETAMALIRKGALISVSGSCHIDEWTGQDGTKQRKVKVSADSFQMLGPKPESQGGPPAPQTGERERVKAQAQAAGRWQSEQLDDDDIPPF